MSRVAIRVLLALAALPLAVWADPPEACGLIKIEELNQIAGGGVVKTQVRKAGNPSECSFIDSRNASVVLVSVREVKYAAENELQYERENLEKIYRSKAKWLKTVGENAFWLPANKQLVFRKGKLIGSVTFSRASNQNETDTAQVARLVEAQLK